MTLNVSDSLNILRSRALPEEKQIIDHWRSADDQPVVSVLCNTFNHKKYIDDALRGFLLQKTTFPFEIVIHDDASTDGTTEIVRAYASRYPKIIKPLIMSENQYSKGVKPTRNAIKHIKGKYVAFCEGDDYWISDDKLQVCVSKLESSSRYGFVGHNTIRHDQKSGDETLFSYKDEDYSFDFRDVVLNKWFVHTSSYVVRASLFDEFYRLDHKGIQTGDFFILGYSLIKGHGYYFANPMSVYRWNADGSLSSSQVNSVRYLDSQIKIYNQLRSSSSSLNVNYLCILGAFKCRLMKIYSRVRASS